MLVIPLVYKRVKVYGSEFTLVITVSGLAFLGGQRIEQQKITGQPV